MTNEQPNKDKKGGPNPIVLFLGLGLIIPIVLLLAIGFRFNPNELDTPLLGKPAPEFTLTDLDGKQWTLSELKGTPVVLNFWATWCGPCKWEHPVLVQAARNGLGGATYLGVVYQDEPEAIQAFVQQHGQWGPVLMDDAGKVSIAYGVYGVPETFFIDSQGIIQNKVAAPLDMPTLQGLLSELQ